MILLLPALFLASATLMSTLTSNVVVSVPETSSALTKVSSCRRAGAGFFHVVTIF